MPSGHGLAAAAAAAVLSFVAPMASGEPVGFCASGAICYAVGVPPGTASSGSGNIYFQISAPATNQWVALGTGTQMRGSNIFLMYQDGRGNVTVSARPSTGHRPPTYDAATASKLTLLSGSGVNGDTMVANVQCANCQSWSGGTMDAASSSTPWIAAWRAGPPLASTDPAEAIAVHDEHSEFTLDLAQARIATDSNPFSGAGPTHSTSVQPGLFPGAGGMPRQRPGRRVIWAHGLGMAIAFSILYPLGSIMMPVFGKWAIHGGWQMVAWLLMWAGFGLGVYGAQQRNMLFTNTHVQFGTVIVCVLAIQPALGWIHHLQFVKTGRRGAYSQSHIWWGRLWMALGVINGGLGLQLAHARHSWVVAYSVVSALVYAFYAGVKAFMYLRPKPGKHGRISSSSTSERKVSTATSGISDGK